MSDEQFADRLDPATYAHDPVVGVFEHNHSDNDALWLSGRLFARLVLVAKAYEMHTLPMLVDFAPVRLNTLQCEALLDELAFVADRLDDGLAVATAQVVAGFVAARVRRPAWTGTVTFEGE